MARDLACSLGMSPDYFYNHEYVGAENPEGWFKNPFTIGDHSRLFNRLKDGFVDYETGDDDEDDTDDPQSQNVDFFYMQFLSRDDDISRRVN